MVAKDVFSRKVNSKWLLMRQVAVVQDAAAGKIGSDTAVPVFEYWTGDGWSKVEARAHDFGTRQAAELFLTTNYQRM